MHPLRRKWLALMGGALLVTLSVSAALGAAPAVTRDATRGQSIAAAVHTLKAAISSPAARSTSAARPLRL